MFCPAVRVGRVATYWKLYEVEVPMMQSPGVYIPGLEVALVQPASLKYCKLSIQVKDN